MNKFECLTEEELLQVDGGALEILIAGKVLTGAAAVGVAGVAIAGTVIVLGGVAYVGYKVASK